MSNSSINVTVKLFAAFGEAYGVSEITVELPRETPVSQVLERSIAQYPQLEQWRDRTRFGLNLEFVSPDTILQDGDEVVLIPPVSGG
ncbi:MoaD/ThiS family protein [Microcoleus sp. LEGE 07076]|uniref:MoaD/ThiS family protein n=1 Tax=Microcoleus sp. LEGE 07076 TaxID=915322 RepID=UPI00187FD969|nr:MoaD/ThiS family protein [Microcoleus sp. LEGE 07076]